LALNIGVEEYALPDAGIVLVERNSVFGFWASIVCAMAGSAIAAAMTNTNSLFAIDFITISLKTLNYQLSAYRTITPVTSNMRP
jgi:hypothetical protein